MNLNQDAERVYEEASKFLDILNEANQALVYLKNTFNQILLVALSLEHKKKFFILSNERAALQEKERLKSLLTNTNTSLVGSLTENFGDFFRSIYPFFGAQTVFAKAGALAIFLSKQKTIIPFYIIRRGKLLVGECLEIKKALQTLRGLVKGAGEIKGLLKILEEHTIEFEHKLSETERAYAKLLELCHLHEMEVEQLAGQLKREFDKRFNYKLGVNSGGQKVIIPVRVIFNFFKMRLKGPKEPKSFAELDEDLGYFMDKFGNADSGMIHSQACEAILLALRLLVENAMDQLAPFVIARSRDGIATGKQITIIVGDLGGSLGRVVARAAWKSGTEGSQALTFNYLRQDDLRFELSTPFVLQVAEGKRHPEELANTMLHELNHIFDNRKDSETILELNKIRGEGLARFSEVVQRPELLRRYDFLKWYYHKPLQTHAELKEAEEDKYNLGLAMWMTVANYFLGKRYGRRVEYHEFLQRSDVRDTLHQYLKVFRNLSTVHFLEMYGRAARGLGFRPVIGADLLASQ